MHLHYISGITYHHVLIEHFAKSTLVTHIKKCKKYLNVIAVITLLHIYLELLANPRRNYLFTPNGPGLATIPNCTVYTYYICMCPHSPSYRKRILGNHRMIHESNESFIRKRLTRILRFSCMD